MKDTVDLAVVGAGAAGLMAAIQAGRAARRDGVPLSIAVLDGAKTLGAKILVSGGGRCNVTHDTVDERAFSGSSPAAIRKVLLRFDVSDTVAFFKELGVEFKREETGKLFPVDDRARTVLDALLRAARDAGAGIHHPWRVASIAREAEGFVLACGGTPDRLRARRVILATGGRSLPRSGSDGHGHAMVAALGHSVTELLPALVPLVLEETHFLRGLSGMTLPAALDLRGGGGRRLVAFTDSTLFTHFGLSGPSVLDMSRHYLLAARSDPETQLLLNLLPGETVETVDRRLAEPGPRSPLARLRERMPERLARALCEHAGIPPATPSPQLGREARRRLAAAAAALPLPVIGDRGYNVAEVTAGGVPLAELHLESLESRRVPGLHLCGELCDVDGRIGGYNFQWAWASGMVAGAGAARAR